MKTYVNEDGYLHKEDGPAIECDNGTKYWYINGKLHREDGPAIECISGSQYWCISGQYHRENGPAIEWYNGTKEWYYNNKFIGWSINGFTQEDFERYLKIREYW